MTKGVTIKRQFHVERGRGSRRHVLPDTKPTTPTGRVPRISRLMALAIRFDQLLRDGVVVDQAGLARYGQVSRSRLSQVMNLLNLAPDIQYELLHLPPDLSGRPRMVERRLRRIAAMPNWHTQRSMWERRKNNQKPGC